MNDNNGIGRALIYGGVVCVIAPLFYYAARAFLISRLIATTGNLAAGLDDPLGVFKWACFVIGVTMISMSGFKRRNP